MTSTTSDFKDALRHFASGVTIVTLRAGERVHGLTVSAFSSVSAEPPLIAVMIDRGHQAHALLAEEGRCSRSTSSASTSGSSPTASPGSRTATASPRGAEGRRRRARRCSPTPWSGSTARSHDRVAAGTHTIFIGRVRAAAVPRPDEAPLVYWNRGYRQLAAEGGTETPFRSSGSSTSRKDSVRSRISDGAVVFRMGEQ